MRRATLVTKGKYYIWRATLVTKGTETTGAGEAALSRGVLLLVASPVRGEHAVGAWTLDAQCPR